MVLHFNLLYPVQDRPTYCFEYLAYGCHEIFYDLVEEILLAVSWVS